MRERGYKKKMLVGFLVFAVFTLLDALLTVVGIRIGCAELNPAVLTLGAGMWTGLRVTMLAILLGVFHTSYNFLSKHSETGIKIFKVTMILLNIYIGTVVLSNFAAIFTQLRF